jgi:PTH1 family peptidyl-tRNA hydrolase
MAGRLRAIVGLGNPGAEYAATRHNAGFWFVDALANSQGASFRAERKFSGDTARVEVAGADLVLLKPSTFMNRSGQSVQALAAFYKLAPAEILVVHDELDVPLGSARFKQGGGPGGHNGLRSLIEHIGPDFARLRIGIGHPGHKDRVHDYVLSRAGKGDEAAMQQAIEAALAALSTLVAGGWDRAVQQLHTTSAAAEAPKRDVKQDKEN